VVLHLFCIRAHFRIVRVKCSRPSEFDHLTIVRWVADRAISVPEAYLTNIISKVFQLGSTEVLTSSYLFITMKNYFFNVVRKKNTMKYLT